MANRFGDIDASFKQLRPVYGYHTGKLVSLEQALEPIQSQIDDLPRYIKVAKKYCHYPSEHGLSQDQSAAVYIYTMEWGETTLYHVLNQALRSENRQALKIWFPYLKLFESALDLLPTVKEVLWRGVNLDIGKTFVKNQVVTWWTINSCSSSVNIIKDFLGNNQNSTMFLIEAVNGKKIAGYTEYESEDEVILRMGTQFRVKSNTLDHPNGSHVVHLIELTNNDDESLASAIDQIHLTGQLENRDVTGKNQPSASLTRMNAKWKQYGLTVAGGNGEGNQLNQLLSPSGIYIDDEDNDHCIYIADDDNHRIVAWKYGVKIGEIAAGGNGEGDRMDQLNHPTDVIVDRKTDSLLICDRGNSRVVRWSRRSGTKGKTVIDDIDCYGLVMDNNGDLYISDHEKNEIRRWKRGDEDGTLVAGGNGEGDQLNQFNGPTYLFVDQDQSVYVSDMYNHRVMKWVKGAEEGIVVAGGRGQGNSLSQLSYPCGVIVDHVGNVYVADSDNHRIMCWSKGSKEGRVIVGGHGQGQAPNQFSSLPSLSFDRQGHLYVVDYGNHRVQKFDIDLT